MQEFIKEHSREARIRQMAALQGGSFTDYPAYIVVYLIHVLVYDTGFPTECCQDEQAYARFCRFVSEDTFDCRMGYLVLFPYNSNCYNVIWGVFLLQPSLLACSGIIKC